MGSLIELKPCPFCGGEAEVVVRDYTDDKASFGEAYAGCTNCFTEQSYSLTEHDAVERWNTRATMEASNG